MFSRLRQRYSNIDLIILAYVLFTGIVIFIFSGRLINEISHLFVRILFIGAIFFISGLPKNIPHFSFVKLFYPFLLIGYFYAETDYLNNIFFNNLDPFFINLDEIIFGSQPSVTFSEFLPQIWISEIMFMGYFSYYLMVFGVPLMMYIYNKGKVEWTVFVVIGSFLLYYLIFIILPVAGPQFYFEDVNSKIPDSLFFGKAVAFVQMVGEGHTGAFPSSHVGVALIFLYITFRFLRSLFYFLLPLVAILILATIYIKAHYFVDILAGILTFPVFLWITNRIYKILQNKKP